jgi:hypothetical protein
MQVPAFLCPTFNGDTTTKLGGVDAAVGNYCAYVGTDLSDPSAAPWKTTNNWENGALPSACWKTANSQTAATAVNSCKDKGVGLRHLSDGISKTIIACESRERVYSAWISGACMWVSATSPQSLAADSMSVGIDSIDQFIAVGTGMAPTITTSGQKGEGIALNFGSLTGPLADYLVAANWATAQTRVYGPSSEHSGNIVMHVWADVHAKAISAEVDPTMYVRLITRSGGDPIGVEEGGL